MKFKSPIKKLKIRNFPGKNL